MTEADAAVYGMSGFWLNSQTYTVASAPARSLFGDSELFFEQCTWCWDSNMKNKLGLSKHSALFTHAYIQTLHCFGTVYDMVLEF